MSRYRWVVFDPVDGPEWFDDPDKAREYADEILGYYREDSGNEGWNEEVTGLCWGEFVPHGVVAQTKCEPAPEGSEFGEIWDFALNAVK